MFKILLRGQKGVDNKDVGGRIERTGNTYHTMASLGIVNISAGS